MFSKVKKEDLEFNLLNLPQLVFEVTDACNLRCKYCAYADMYEGYDKRMNQNFPFYKAKLLIDYLSEIWSRGKCEGVINPINIGFYGGEPLLNIQLIFSIVNYLEGLDFMGKKYIYSMTTNAMLLDKYMDYLVEKNFRLLISLDGDKEGQGYRVDVLGNNSFDRVYKNICLLREKYPEYFYSMVKFNSVLHSKNSVESIYSFIEGEFDKTPSISPVSNLHIRKDKLIDFERIYRNYNDSIESANDCESFRDKIFIANPKTNMLLDYIYKYSGNVFYNYNHLFVRNEMCSLIPTGTCVPFSKKMFVTVTGKVLQCERIGHEFSLGQITETGVELDLEQIADLYNKYVFKFISQCMICANMKNCSYCVFQMNNIRSEQTICPYYCSAQQKDKQKDEVLVFLNEHPKLYDRILKEVVVRG